MQNFQSHVAVRTGIDAVDHDHQLLLDTISETCASLQRRSARERVLDTLGLLYVRVCSHFALEEKMLREHSPELYPTRKARYEALLERIRVMMDAFYDGECDLCDKSLEDCLRSWLQQHLQTEHRRAGPALS